MKSFSSKLGDAVTPFSLRLLTLLLLLLNPCSTTAALKGTFLRNIMRRKLDESQIVGGYSPVTEENFQQLADASSFAFEQLQAAPANYSISAEPGASAQATDYIVNEAYIQVVAGLNIKMDMKFSDSSGACVGAATVVVYDRFGTMSITSWDPIDNACATSAPGAPVAEPGGYQEIPVDKDDVVAASSLAFETLQSNSSAYALPSDASSYEVTAASRQIVAGLNIKMDMLFFDSSGACVGSATVVVYDHFGDMSITSYEPSEDGCPAVPESSSYCIPKCSTLFLIQTMLVTIFLK
jgi:uncharacterized protein (DUF779 family)